MAALASAKDLGLEVRAPPGDARCVVGDVYRLHQILLNLLVNAIKFTGQGHIELGAEVLAEIPEALALRFWAADTGIGIDPAEQGHIFEAFAQASADTSRRFGGTGLASSQQPAGGADGRCVGPAQRPGPGQYVLVRASPAARRPPPVARRPPPAARRPPPAARRPPPAARRPPPVARRPPPAARRPPPAARSAGSGPLPFEDLRGLRVLLAEDNSLNQLIARVVLEHWGMVVVAVGNDPDALAQLREHDYDAAILDIRMPGLSRVEVTMALRALRDVREVRRAGVSIITLTDNALETDRLACLVAGINAYLVKPYEEAALCQPRLDLTKAGSTDPTG